MKSMNRSLCFAALLPSETFKHDFIVEFSQ